MKNITVRITISLAAIFLGVSFAPQDVVAVDVCSPYQTVAVSGTSTRVSGTSNFAVETYRSPIWTSLPEATWIWTTFKVENPNIQETKTFTQNFAVGSTIATATLQIAADDYFKVYVNNSLVATENGENNFTASKSYNVAPYLNASGTNALTVEATNAAFFFAGLGTPENNPGGALFRLTVSGQNCVATSTATTTPPSDPGPKVDPLLNPNAPQGGGYSGPVGVSTPQTVAPTVGTSISTPGVLTTLSEPVYSGIGGGDDTYLASVGSVSGLYTAAATTSATSSVATSTPVNTTENNNLVAAALPGVAAVDDGWGTCTLIAFIILLVLYIIGEFVFPEREENMKRLTYFVIASIVSILALIFLQACVIVPLIVLGIILCVLVYMKVL